MRISLEKSGELGGGTQKSFLWLLLTLFWVFGGRFGVIIGPALVFDQKWVENGSKMTLAYFEVFGRFWVKNGLKMGRFWVGLGRKWVKNGSVLGWFGVGFGFRS